MEDQYQGESGNFRFLSGSLVELIKDQIEEAELAQYKKHQVKVKEAEGKIGGYEALVKDLRQVQDQLKTKNEDQSKAIEQGREIIQYA